MVEVRYQERLGNNFFQYCLGRIIATHLGFALKADPIPGFPNTRARIEGEDYSSYPVQLLQGLAIDLGSVLSDRSKRKIVLDGFFQRYEYYKPYKDQIRNDWLVMDYPLKERIGESDIVVTLRLRDFFVFGSVLPFSYYEEALGKADFERLFICTDDVGDPFLRRFKKYRPVIVPRHPLEDFKLIMSCPQIILSQGTFHWWAAFLSDAKTIYAPAPTFGYWAHPPLDFRVDDEDRYVYISCTRQHKDTIIEGLERKVRKIFGQGKA